MRPPLAALSALLLALLAAPGVRAGSQAGTLLWAEAGTEAAAESLLLVLERRDGAWRLVQASTAPVAAKPRLGTTGGPGPVLAVLDEEGRPLAAARLRVPEAVHGPILDDEGVVRCIAHPDENPVVAVRLPLVRPAAGLALYRAAEHAPAGGEELARALAARPSDAGLELLASFALEPGGRP